MPIFEPLPLDFNLLMSGEFLLRQFTRSSEWLRRRVDTISFEDHRTMRLRTEFHVDFTQVVQASDATWHSMMPLPIQCLERRRAGLIELRHAEGSLLPQFTRNEERCLVAAGLVLLLFEEGYASRVEAIRNDPDRFDDLYTEILKFIDPDLYADASETALPVTDSSAGWRRLLRFFSTHRLVILACTPREQSEATERVAAATPTSELRSMVTLDRIIPLGAERSFQSSAFKTSPGEVRVEFDIAGAAECESYHLNVSPPPNTFVDHMKVATRRPTQVAPGLEPPSVEIVGTVATACAPPVTGAHVYLPYSAHNGDLLDRAKTSTVASISIRPMTMGLMRSGLLASLLATCTMLFILATYVWQAAGWRFLFPFPTLGEGDVQSIVTAIMLGPTLLPALLVRHQEHLMTKRVATFHRHGLALQAALSTAAAVLLAVGVSGTWLGWLFLWLCGLSLLISGNLGIVYFNSQRALSAEPLTTLSKIVSRVVE